MERRQQRKQRKKRRKRRRRKRKLNNLMTKKWTPLLRWERDLSTPSFLRKRAQIWLLYWAMLSCATVAVCLLLRFSIACGLWSSKVDPQMRFSLPSIKWSAGPSSLCSCAQRFDYCALRSSRKLGGAAEYLIDGREKRICRLSFEF